MRRAIPAVLTALVVAAALSSCGAVHRSARRLIYSPSHTGAGNAVVGVHTARRLVALTFDDGPDPRWTPRILAILHDYHAQATFFDVGRSVSRWPSIVRLQLRAGNEAGNHTFDHPHLPRLDSRALAGEVDQGERALSAASAPLPRFFRPPYGDFNARVSTAVKSAHELLVGWDLPLERFLNRYGVRHGVARLLTAVHPGSIVLAHDGRGNRETTLAALPRMLLGLRAGGFRVVSVGALLRSVGVR